MVDILLTTFSNEFSWNKTFVLWFKFQVRSYWSYWQWVRLGSDSPLLLNMWKVIIRTNDNTVHWGVDATPGPRKFIYAIWGIFFRGWWSGNYSTGARLDARTYTFAHPIWRTTNAARKQGAISPILPVFCRYYLCDAIMLIKLSMVWPWVTGITTLEVAIVVLNFARDARMNRVNVCRMRERIKQDARTSLLMRERTHIVHWGSFY